MKAPTGLRAKQLADAAALKELILQLITDHGPLSASAIADYVDTTAKTVREYAHRMIREGSLKSDLIVGRSSGTAGNVTAYYSLSDGQGGGELILNPNRNMGKARQVIRTKYPQHHERDTLVAALFGPAQPRNEP